MSIAVPCFLSRVLRHFCTPNLSLVLLVAGGTPANPRNSEQFSADEFSADEFSNPRVCRRSAGHGVFVRFHFEAKLFYCSTWWEAGGSDAIRLVRIAYGF